jgi:hypothetical protein
MVTVLEPVAPGHAELVAVIVLFPGDEKETVRELPLIVGLSPVAVQVQPFGLAEQLVAEAL